MKIFVFLVIYFIQDLLNAKEFHPNDFESSNDIPLKFSTFMAERDENKRWENATIVYQIVLTDFRKDEIDGLLNAMDIYQKETCLKFRPAKFSDQYSVIIRRGSGGCNAILGQDRKKGTQTVNLGIGCRWYGLFLHELGHTIGLHHEHQHPDRDIGVSVQWDNVDPSMKVWFNTISRDDVSMFGVPYDMQSVMHYGQWAFAKTDANGKSLTTIIAKNPEFQRYLYYVWMKDLSFGDVKRINLMYKCNDHCPKNIPCSERDGFITKDCKCETKQNFANRRCYDVFNSSECQRLKADCDKTGTYEQYYVFTNCRKTCRKCYEAI
uniref:Metalloendopeptidase n=1 Tax=Schmidtea mediterranea TaxID=79327 RepID=A0A060Q6V2_SCHMD|nr:Ast8 protein [Schmidtea mediterranea]